MEAIAATGLRTVTISELTRLLASPEPNNPDRLLAITFDDGFEEVHRIALPILADLGLRASTFVVTRFVGKTSRWLNPLAKEIAPFGGPRSRSWLRPGSRSGATAQPPELDTLGLSEVSNEVHHSRVLLGATAAADHFLRLPTWLSHQSDQVDRRSRGLHGGVRRQARPGQCPRPVHWAGSLFQHNL